MMGVDVCMRDQMYTKLAYHHGIFHMLLDKKLTPITDENMKHQPKVNEDITQVER